jgi:hypothetical protein
MKLRPSAVNKHSINTFRAIVAKAFTLSRTPERFPKESRSRLKILRILPAQNPQGEGL